MERVYNKLVRDSILNLIISKREISVTRVLSNVIRIAEEKSIKRGAFNEKIFFKKIIEAE